MADPTLEDVANRLRQLSDGELMDAMEIIALKFGLTAADRVKRGMNTKKLKVRTGRLRASVKSEVERTRSSIKEVAAHTATASQDRCWRGPLLVAVKANRQGQVLRSHEQEEESNPV